MSDQPLYQLGPLALGASNLVYVSRDDGSADGKATLTAVAAIIAGVNGANYQPANANLTTFAAIAPSANVQTFLGAADYAAMRTQLGLVIGTNVQAWDADLDALAALSGTDTIYRRSGAGTWSAVTIGSGLSFSSGTLSSTASGGTVTHTAGSLISGQLIVGNGSADLKAGDLSGDVSTSGSGLTTIGALKVATGMIQADAATLVKLSGLIMPPQGRLTLTSATPVLTADATAQGTVYYTPYVGSMVPIYSGSLWNLKSFSELTLTLNSTDNTSTNLYDIFVFNNSGTLTLGTGPAWTNATTRSAAIALLAGIWTNNASITLRAGGSSLGSQAANTCTYLGTIYCTANGQTGMAFKPAAAAGGSNAILGLWNAYNRVRTMSMSRDSTSSSWTCNSTAYRASNNSTSNRISWVDGLQLSAVRVVNKQGVSPSNTSAAIVGTSLDSTSAAPVVIGQINGSSVGVLSPVTVPDEFTPQLGFHYAQAIEAAASAVAQTFFGAETSPTRQHNALIAELEM